jgi:hypothetical protein
MLLEEERLVAPADLSPPGSMLSLVKMSLSAMEAVFLLTPPWKN